MTIEFVHIAIFSQTPKFVWTTPQKGDSINIESQKMVKEVKFINIVMPAKMEKNGRIVIPKSVRREIGAENDTLFKLSVIDGKIIIEKTDTPKNNI